MKVTPAMKAAYLWLQERDGVGILDRYGRMMACGVVASHIAPETWLRLVAADLLIAQEGHLVLTENPGVQ